MEQLSQVQRIVTCFRENLNPKSALKEEENCQRKFCCCTTTPVPHTAAHTLETVKQLKWEAMEHPPYSPDLVSSDFHLFGPLKIALRGRRFSCDDDVKAAVRQWLRAQPETFFADGIIKLVGCWEKYIAKRQGDCIEK